MSSSVETRSQNRQRRTWRSILFAVSGAVGTLCLLWLIAGGQGLTEGALSERVEPRRAIGDRSSMGEILMGGTSRFAAMRSTRILATPSG